MYWLLKWQLGAETAVSELQPFLGMASDLSSIASPEFH
jgi:hypothetical protein